MSRNYLKYRIILAPVILAGFTACQDLDPGIKVDLPVSTETTFTTETVHITETATHASRTPMHPETKISETSEIPEIIEIPESVLLEDVPYYSQEDILPTGCEIISAKMLLEFYTHQETEIEEMLSVIPCQYPEEKNHRLYAPHPENAFIGSPWDESSFGCFAPVIVRMLNHLLPDAYQAVDTSGTDLQELAENYLPQGTPVLVWETIEMWNPFPNISWYLYNERGYPTDHEFQWLANEHCMVLIGYDADYYYFQDPYESNGTVAFRKEISEKRYEEIGCYSAVVTKK